MPPFRLEMAVIAEPSIFAAYRQSIDQIGEGFDAPSILVAWRIEQIRGAGLSCLTEASRRGTLLSLPAEPLD